MSDDFCETFKAKETASSKNRSLRLKSRTPGEHILYSLSQSGSSRETTLKLSQRKSFVFVS